MRQINVSGGLRLRNQKGGLHPVRLGRNTGASLINNGRFFLFTDGEEDCRFS